MSIYTFVVVVVMGQCVYVHVRARVSPSQASKGWVDGVVRASLSQQTGTISLTHTHIYIYRYKKQRMYQVELGGDVGEGDAGVGKGNLAQAGLDHVVPAWLVVGGCCCRIGGWVVDVIYIYVYP